MLGIIHVSHRVPLDIRTCPDNLNRLVMWIESRNRNLQITGGIRQTY